MMECATAFVLGVIVGSIALAVALLTGEDEDGDDE